MTIHELKCEPAEFYSVLIGDKTFEFRLDDRGYEVGDVLTLREYNVVMRSEKPNARTLAVQVRYVLRGPHYNIPDGYCIMSVVPYSRNRKTPIADALEGMFGEEYAWLDGTIRGYKYRINELKEERDKSRRWANRHLEAAQLLTGRLGAARADATKADQSLQEALQEVERLKVAIKNTCDNKCAYHRHPPTCADCPSFGLAPNPTTEEAGE